MSILGYELKKVKESLVQESTENPPGTMKQEVSYADSSYFQKYQDRPYDPSTLWQRFGNYNIYDDMREDDQIKATLSLKKLITLNSDWVIECDDEVVVDFLTKALSEYMDDSLTKKLYQILSAMDYGFSVTEKILGSVDFEGTQKWAFTKLKTRAPHTFEFHADDQGNLPFILQHTKKEQLRLDPKKFIVYSYQKEFDNWYGTAELNKGVYRAWWSKEAIIKFWGIYLERYAAPLPVGTIPGNAGVDDRNRFKSIMNNIQAKSGVTLPEGYDLKYLLGNDGNSQYKEAIDAFNLMIARSMLLPDLVGFSGDQTSGGSFSLGQEQFDIFYTTIEYLRQDIERIVNTELIIPLVNWNFGNKIQASFKFQQIDADRKAADLKLWIEAVKTGKIPVPIEHMNHLYGIVDFPEVEESELQKIEDEKKEMAESMGGVGEEKDSKEKEKPAKDKKEKPTDEKKFIKNDFFRDLTRYEKKEDFVKIESSEMAIEDKYYKELGDAYKLVINALVNDIKSKKIVEKKRLDQINKLTLKHQAKTKQIWSRMLKESYALGKNSVVQEFALIDPAGFDNEDIVEWLKTEPEYLNEVEGGHILKKSRGTLINGIRSGDSISEMATQLGDSLKGYDISLKADRLNLIVRTEVNRAFNQARRDQYVGMDDIVAYQYSAIMDGRTSDICSSLDMKVFRPSEVDFYNPPNHFRCRSLLVPIFSDEVEDDFDFDNMPNTRQEDGGFLKLVKEKK